MSRREAWLTSWNIRNPWIFSLKWSQPQDFIKTLHTRREIWSCRDARIAVWSVRDAMVFFSKIVRKSGSGTPLPSPPSLNKKILKLIKNLSGMLQCQWFRPCSGCLFLVFYYVSSLGEKRNFLGSIFCSEQNNWFQTWLYWYSVQKGPLLTQASMILENCP